MQRGFLFVMSQQFIGCFQPVFSAVHCIDRNLLRLLTPFRSRLFSASHTQNQLMKIYAFSYLKNFMIYLFPFELRTQFIHIEKCSYINTVWILMGFIFSACVCVYTKEWRAGEQQSVI